MKKSIDIFNQENGIEVRTPDHDSKLTSAKTKEENDKVDIGEKQNFSPEPQLIEIIEETKERPTN